MFLFRCQPLFGGLYLSGGGGGVAMEGELFSEGNLRCVMLITRLELCVSKYFNPIGIVLIRAYKVIALQCKQEQGQFSRHKNLFDMLHST